VFQLVSTHLLIHADCCERKRLSEPEVGKVVLVWYKRWFFEKFPLREKFVVPSQLPTVEIEMKRNKPQTNTRSI
jgi:hypothetical protein